MQGIQSGLSTAQDVIKQRTIFDSVGDIKGRLQNLNCRMESLAVRAGVMQPTPTTNSVAQPVRGENLQDFVAESSVILNRCLELMDKLETIA